MNKYYAEIRCEGEAEFFWEVGFRQEKDGKSWMVIVHGGKETNYFAALWSLIKQLRCVDPTHPFIQLGEHIAFQEGTVMDAVDGDRMRDKK